MLSSRRESSKVGTSTSGVHAEPAQTKRTKQVENAVAVTGKQLGKQTTKTFGQESREFGREIGTNQPLNGNQSQQTLSAAGKMKTSVSVNQQPDSKANLASKPQDQNASQKALGPLSSRIDRSQTLGTKDTENENSASLLQRCKSNAGALNPELVPGEITSVAPSTSGKSVKAAKSQQQKEHKGDEPPSEKKAAEVTNVSVSETFKERLVNYRKQISKKMVFADQLDLREPQMVAEFAFDIFNNMKKLEREYQVHPDYLSKVQLPTEVKDTSRAFLVEWIIDVHRKFRLLPETLYVTVYLIDRFLSLKQIKKSQLHILGVTSLLISTKYEEIYPPELKDLLSVSENKFSRTEVLAMEQDMLQTLQFEVTTPSAYRFLERYRKLSSVVGNDDKVFFLAQYIQEIALLDASLLKYTPSELAAASLILSGRCLKKSAVWNKEMEKSTKYKDDYLQPIVEDVKSFVVEVNPKFLTTLKYKFSKVDYAEVANIAFKF